MKPLFTVNGMPFVPNPECEYKHDYAEMLLAVKQRKLSAMDTHRYLLTHDLWFFVFFCLKVPHFNHPFIVKACNDVQDGPRNMTLDLWAREHGKTTIITVGDSLRWKLHQRVVNGYDERICILSYKRTLAKDMLRVIKTNCESNDYLRAHFPDVIPKKPNAPGRKWSEDEGICLIRDVQTKEQCFEAGGLIDGMPTGKHYTGMIFDDCMTMDLAKTPNMIGHVKDCFDMALNLGSDGGWHRVVGTIYAYDDVNEYIKNKVRLDGTPLYQTRIKTATDDGTITGKSVFLSEDYLASKKSNIHIFNCQQLLNPMPEHSRKFSGKDLIVVPEDMIPTHLYRFIVVDGAGDADRVKRRDRADNWAIGLWGVKPYMDDAGLSDVYLLDAVIAPLSLNDALEAIVRLYLTGGQIRKLGVESTGASFLDTHVSNALRAKGKHVTVENERLQVLSPGARNKERRILNYCSTPFSQNKVKVSSRVPSTYVQNFREEMDKFPLGHDDCLDMTAYLYEMIGSYRFPKEAYAVARVDEREDAYEVEFLKQEKAKRSAAGWMSR